ncbi:MAG: hypothetical protein VKP62_05010 [Candidatus Sericytochromatia bacterium]|nr:hypothetical protein [Candidatus Sericytochromatia bacterium]
MSSQDHTIAMSRLRTSAERTYRVSRAAAELAVTAGSAHQRGGVGALQGSAQVALKYKALKSEVGLAHSSLEERLFGLAGDVATVSGGILAAIALPTMSRKAATSFQELTALVRDPSATAEVRLNKLEEMVRAGAGSIFSAQGVVVGARGTMGILTRSEGIARVTARVGESPLFRFLGTPLGKFLQVLLPVADVAVLVGESIATRRTFLDPQTTSGQRARKVLDLSLSCLKAAFWLLPAARPLKAAYAAASFAQLGLTLRDFWPLVRPALTRASQTTLWALQHPGEALGAARTSLGNGLRVTGQALVSVAQGSWFVLTHPGYAWSAVHNEVSAWLRLLQGKAAAAIPFRHVPVFLAPSGPAAAAPEALSPGGLAAPTVPAPTLAHPASAPVPSLPAPTLAPPVTTPVPPPPAPTLAPPVTSPVGPPPAPSLAPPIITPTPPSPAPTPVVVAGTPAAPVVPSLPLAADPLSSIPAQ